MLQMNEYIVYAAVPVLIAAGVIAIAEAYDRKSSDRQRRILNDGIKVTGAVHIVERDALMKSAFMWRISVDFEYNGKTYSAEKRSIGKPALNTGDHVTVYVCREDPYKSFFV